MGYGMQDSGLGRASASTGQVGSFGSAIGGVGANIAGTGAGMQDSYVGAVSGRDHDMQAIELKKMENRQRNNELAANIAAGGAGGMAKGLLGMS
jgi:hypothetical protein